MRTREMSFSRRDRSKGSAPPEEEVSEHGGSQFPRGKATISRGRRDIREAGVRARLVAGYKLQEPTGKGAGNRGHRRLSTPPVKGRPLIGRAGHAPGGQLLRYHVRACVSAVTASTCECTRTCALSALHRCQHADQRAPNVCANVNLPCTQRNKRKEVKMINRHALAIFANS